LMTTSSIDIGADEGRLSIELRSRVSVPRLPSTSGLIRAKPRPVRTGLELRINFSLYRYGKGLPVHYITYGNARKFPHLLERNSLKAPVTCALPGWMEPSVGIEPTICSLRMSRSTTEPRGRTRQLHRGCFALSKCAGTNYS
jgi:hypothetical protein